MHGVLLAVLITVIFLLLSILLISLFLLKKYIKTDRQIAQLIETQKTFDLMWINLKTKRFISKGNHSFFREWGLNFSGASCLIDEISRNFGRDMYKEYTAEMRDMEQNGLNFVVYEKAFVSKITGKTMHYRKYLHRINSYEFMSCMQDITDEKERTDELTLIAETDFLSNLLTRRAMNEKLIAKCDELLENGGGAFIIMIDIDDFKQINDNYGHEAGDITLRIVSDIIQSTEGCANSTSRWGGEEFLILLECEDVNIAAKCAESIINAVRKCEVLVGGKKIDVKISAGLARLHPDIDYTYSVRRADKALYEAKRDGKDCLRVKV